MNRALIRVSRRNMSLFTSAHKLELPKLDYGYGDLDPVLNKENVELHHKKHHQKYIDKYNNFIEEYKAALDKGDLAKATQLTPELKFNGGSHINHSLYWKMLAPVKQGGGQIPSKDAGLGKHIIQTWGSQDNFNNAFIEKAASLHGVGWAWLIYCKKSKNLSITNTKDQDPVILCKDTVPVLTVDVWEHAWYPTHKNEKEKYLKEIWKIINWKYCEQRYQEGNEKL